MPYCNAKSILTQLPSIYGKGYPKRNTFPLELAEIPLIPLMAFP